MKKTQYIDLAHMRKASRTFSAKRLSLAIAAISLAACSDNREEVLFVADAQDCADKSKMTMAECTKAYEKALAESEKTAPKYSGRAQCEVEFGDNQCYRQSSTGFFLPFMAGFMVSNLMDRYRDNYSYNPGYYHRDVYGSRRDRIVTADGYVLGSPNKSSYRVPAKATKPKPKTTTTFKRGGFGSSVSAKSSWGGGKSSRSWGS